MVMFCWCRALAWLGGDDRHAGTSLQFDGVNPFGYACEQLHRYVCAHGCGDGRGCGVLMVGFGHGHDRSACKGRESLTFSVLKHGMHLSVWRATGRVVSVMLLRRWTITGTMEPLRGLSRLTQLDLTSNNIGGMSVRATFGAVL